MLCSKMHEEEKLFRNLAIKFTSFNFNIKNLELYFNEQKHLLTKGCGWKHSNNPLLKWNFWLNVLKYL
jgi:hypothetical protein